MNKETLVLSIDDLYLLSTFGDKSLLVSTIYIFRDIIQYLEVEYTRTRNQEERSELRRKAFSRSWEDFKIKAGFSGVEITPHDARRFDQISRNVISRVVEQLSRK